MASDTALVRAGNALCFCAFYDIRDGFRDAFRLCFVGGA